MMVAPPAGKSALGLFTVRGYVRVDRPAQSKTAFMFVLM
jgi:hypothetical protein